MTDPCDGPDLNTDLKTGGIDKDEKPGAERQVAAACGGESEGANMMLPEGAKMDAVSGPAVQIPFFEAGPSMANVDTEIGASWSQSPPDAVCRVKGSPNARQFCEDAASPLHDCEGLWAAAQPESKPTHADRRSKPIDIPVPEGSSQEARVAGLSEGAATLKIDMDELVHIYKRDHESNKSRSQEDSPGTEAYCIRLDSLGSLKTVPSGSNSIFGMLTCFDGSVQAKSSTVSEEGVMKLMQNTPKTGDHESTNYADQRQLFELGEQHCSSIIPQGENICGKESTYEGTEGNENTPDETGNNEIIDVESHSIGTESKTLGAEHTDDKKSKMKEKDTKLESEEDHDKKTKPGKAPTNSGAETNDSEDDKEEIEEAVFDADENDEGKEEKEEAKLDAEDNDEENAVETRNRRISTDDENDVEKETEEEVGTESDSVDDKEDEGTDETDMNDVEGDTAVSDDVTSSAEESCRKEKISETEESKTNDPKVTPDGDTLVSSATSEERSDHGGVVFADCKATEHQLAQENDARSDMEKEVEITECGSKKQLAGTRGVPAALAKPCSSNDGPQPAGVHRTKDLSATADSLVKELLKDTPSAEQLRAALAQEFPERGAHPAAGLRYDVFWSSVGLLRRYEDPMRRPLDHADASPAPEEEEEEGAAALVENEQVAAAIDAIDALFPGSELEEDEEDDEVRSLPVVLQKDDEDDDEYENKARLSRNRSPFQSMSLRMSESMQRPSPCREMCHAMYMQHVDDKKSGEKKKKKKSSFAKRLRKIISSTFRLRSNKNV